MISIPPSLIRMTIGISLAVTLSTAYSMEDVMQHRHGPDPLENELIEVLDEIQSLHYDKALSRVKKLSENNPKFKLAQLIYADLMLAMAEPIKKPGANQAQVADKLKGLIDEARVRWEHYNASTETDRLPSNLLQLSSKQRHAIIVDLKNSRLYLYENRDGELRYSQDYYISQGRKGPKKQKEGDLRTPIGVYHVTSHIPGDKLPDLYGAGAFPVNYPNEWDRRQGKTGNGIWVHGNPSNTYSRAPLSSEGCVTLSNRDFRQMKPLVQVTDTPVVFADEIEWLTRSEWNSRRTVYLKLLEQWRSDWESLNAERYLSHYSKAFHSGMKNYDEWRIHKERINGSKRFIKVNLDNVSIYQYPDDDSMIVVEFLQDYHSSNYKGQLRKRQYWRLEDDGKWRIYYEGSA